LAIKPNSHRQRNSFTS